MTTQQEPDVTTKNVRITLTDRQWRALRIMAAKQGNSVSLQASLCIGVALTQDRA